MTLQTQGAENQDLIESCLNDLIESGSIKLESGRYRLTDKGQKKVLKELQKYALRPGMFVLMEMWYAEKFGLEMR